MTSQPDSPVTDRMGIDEDAMEAEQVVEEDADPDAAVGAEATGTPVQTGAIEPGGDLRDGTQDMTDLSGSASVEDNVRPADLGQQWHDIQAMFVDDPHGSVELAAAAADAAVSALVETLHQRGSELASAGSTSADPGGTEQLREALRSYRIFCQSLTEIGLRLAQPPAMTR